MLGLNFSLHWPTCIVGKAWKNKRSEVLRSDKGKGSPSCAPAQLCSMNPATLQLSSAPAPEMNNFQDNVALGEGLML